MDDYSNWRGKIVLGKDGTKIGTLSELYVVDDSNHPKFAAVQTGLFGTKQTFIPISLASILDDYIILATTEDHVKNAPQIDIDEILEENEERKLYEHYGVIWNGAPHNSTDHEVDTYSETGVSGPPRLSGAISDDAGGTKSNEVLAASEEQATAGTERDKADRVRLKKYIVTERRLTNVPVQRGSVHIDRQPIIAASRSKAVSENARKEQVDLEGNGNETRS